MKEIIFNLGRLREELKASENPAVDYIENLLSKLSSAESAEGEISKTLKLIKNGSKIVDYANFSQIEESIWIEIWRDAKKILKNSDFNPDEVD